MKRINSIFFAAAAAAFSLVSCSQENLAPVEKSHGELVAVHFGAESGIASTKATLTTEDEVTFKSAWEAGDVLSVEYLNGELSEDVVSARWDGSKFNAELPSYTGNWDYDALYPSPTSGGTVDFGSVRTQNGNKYNSKYDLMHGDVEAENAPAGKDDAGNDVIFKMNRQTAIAYFRFTGDLDENVVSATLSVEGEVAAIASSVVMPLDYKKGFDLSTKDLKSITITFEDGTAPKATDFQLWFNVLPTEYTSMKLEVETTGHKLTLSNSNAGEYVAGNLYKVVKPIASDKWVAKTAPATELSYKVEFNSTTANEALINDNTNTKASTVIVAGAEYVASTPFSSVSKAYYGGDKNGLPLRLGTKNASGSVTIALSDKGKVEATKVVLSAKQYSSGKTKKIGVNGSAKQQPDDDYTDLTFVLDGKPLQSIKLDTDGYIYVKSITVVYPAPTPTCAAPVITLDGAIATIDCATEGSEIHYTIGDSPADPTASDAVYSSPLTLSEGQTIKAIAVKDGLKSSAVVSKKYVTGEQLFEKTYAYGALTDWSLTNYSDQKSYYLIPSSDTPSVATISGVFANKVILSDIEITLNVATYGGGNDPSASTFSIYTSSDCSTSVSAVKSGTLPTSKTFTDLVYTVKQNDASSFVDDLAIKITKPGKQIRLKSINVSFKYTAK